MRMVRFLAVLMWGMVSLAYAEDLPPARVVVTTVKIEKISKDQDFLGTLYYERISHVSSEAYGLVKEVYVSAGDKVKKGAPLVRLDTESLEKEIAIHQNQLGISELSIAHLEKMFQRIETLYQKGSASEMAYDDALFSLEQARLTRLSTQKKLEKLYITVRKSTIRSPFDGVILKKDVDKGAWVSQGRTLMDIGSSGDIFVQVPVSETLLRFVNPGEKVEVMLHAYARNMTGTIRTISPIADPKTKNVFLKIHIPTPEDIIIAQNMSAAVKIPTSQPETLALITRDALIKFRGRDFVYLAKEGKAQILPVKIIRYMGMDVGVDGTPFKNDTQVVIEGNERLRPGQSIEITGEK